MGNQIMMLSGAKFDYGSLDAESRIVVQQKTDELKQLLRNAAQNIYDIGGKLADVRDKLQHNKAGGFDGWLAAEFGMSRRTAYNFIGVYEAFSNRANFAQLNIAASALYLLAAPSTPDEVRDAMLAKAEAGEPVTYGDTRRAIEDARDEKPEKSDPVKDAMATAAERRAARLARALDDAPAPVIQAVRSFGIDEPELVEDLKRLHKSDGKPGSSDTFSEILATGWIQPGDEEEAVHITEGVEKVRAALRQKTGIHIQIGRDIAQANHQLINQSDNNEWYTPARYIKSVHEVLGQVDVDPASNEYANRIIQAKTFYTIDNDGFAQEWPGKVFMNPPYGRDDAGNDSNQARWSRRLIEQYKAGIVTEAILLVNAVPGNRWFAPLWEFPICFVDHRIRFYSRDVEAGQPTHSNAFVYMGPNVDRFAAAFSKHGVIAVQYKPTAEAVELSHVA